MLFLSGLSLHLLHFNGVRLPPPHVQLVVSHAQRQDALVDPQPWSIEHKVLRGVKIMNLSGSLTARPVKHQSNTYWSFLVDGLDDKLLVVEGNVSDFAPGKADLWWKPEVTIKKNIIFTVYEHWKYEEGRWNVSLAVPADGAVVKLVICTVTEEAKSHVRSREKFKGLMWQAFGLSETNEICSRCNFWGLGFRLQWNSKCNRFDLLPGLGLSTAMTVTSLYSSLFLFFS